MNYTLPSKLFILMVLILILLSASGLTYLMSH